MAEKDRQPRAYVVRLMEALERCVKVLLVSPPHESMMDEWLQERQEVLLQASELLIEGKKRMLGNDKQSGSPGD